MSDRATVSPGVRCAGGIDRSDRPARPHKRFAMGFWSGRAADRMCASGAPVSGSSRSTGGVEETRQVEAQPGVGRVPAKENGLSNWASRRHKQTKLRCAAGEYPLPIRQAHACWEACPGCEEGWEQGSHSGDTIGAIMARFCEACRGSPVARRKECSAWPRRGRRWTCCWPRRRRSAQHPRGTGRESYASFSMVSLAIPYFTQTKRVRVRDYFQDCRFESTHGVTIRWCYW